MNNSCAKCRREGEKLMIKGERCASPKCALIKRPYAPGQHGQGSRSKLSEYGKQLREKQKTRRIYGLGEKQFSNCAQKAEKMQGNTADNLLKLLELRLDNVVFRSGYALSRAHARQMVNHGKFLVNGKKASIPSYLLQPTDKISPVSKEEFKELASTNVPSWVSMDHKKLEVEVLHEPLREEIDIPVNESLIIEFYSR